jgi:hypothetical protein
MKAKIVGINSADNPKQHLPFYFHLRVTVLFKRLNKANNDAIDAGREVTKYRRVLFNWN